MRTRLTLLLCVINIIVLSLISCSDSASDISSSLIPMAGEISDGMPCDPYTNTKNELRGVYIATAYNIDFPSKAGLSAEKLADELSAIVDKTESFGCNAIFFQVRPNSDAMYDSDIFPVSEYLTGKTDGELPDGFDPLLYLINIAHERGIEVHAWVNPLRVTRGSISKPKTDTEALAKTNPAILTPYITVPYAGELYYDAGYPETRALVAAGVKEIVKNYDVDGIIFDDYFYPYPEEDENGSVIIFDDSASYEAYGQGKTLEDFRRESVNSMIKSCYEAVKSTDESCRFGVAPFGIWQNYDGENDGSMTAGMEGYSEIFCDAIAWAEGGYVDYLAPQIYWNFSKKSAPYAEICEFWNRRLDGTGVELYISHAAYKYGTDEWISAGAVDELTSQIKFARELITYRGSLFYGFDELKNDTDGVASELTVLYENSEIIYADAMSTGVPVSITSPENGATVSGDTAALYGESDPTLTFTYNGKKLSRKRDGSFMIELSLSDGENYVVLYSDAGKYVYVINKADNIG